MRLFDWRYPQAVWPIGGMADSGSEVATEFFQAYLALPIVIAFWIGGYAWKRERPRRAHEIDLDVSSLPARSPTALCSDSQRLSVSTPRY